MERNLTMMTDLYELTMMNGYYRKNMGQNIAVFDMFYRRSGDDIAHAVVAGLEQLVDYIENLRFSRDDLEYLKSLKIFDEGFLEYLANFRFTGELTCVPEGTIVFPGEPIVTVRAPLIEAQLLEAALLNIMNHQTLIATKAARVVQAAAGGNVMEFGLRRAQGPDAGIYGARAAMIAGCTGTSNVLTGEMYHIPVSGTHAHSWVMSFNTELEAFRAYAEIYPDACMLLVDTYDMLKSGIPNAITVFKELRAAGHEPVGIRMDSGDMAYMSRMARKMLDEAGFPNAKICASGDLDEEVIWDLKAQGACIDSWGVGTRLITSRDNPALGGVYKLAAEEIDGEMIPRIKISENPEKITNPGDKVLYRVYDKQGRAMADLIALKTEKYDESQPLVLFDPVNTWKQMTLTEYTLRPLHETIFKDGKRIYQLPELKDIITYAAKERNTFWDEYRRLHKPHIYKVDLSRPLWELKQSLLNKRG